MIKYNIAGLYEQHPLILYFLELYQNNREFFRPNVQIESVFGNFPYCTWDGGRNFPYYSQVYKEDVEELKSQYLVHGVNPRFIFTNPEITEEDLDDRWCNFLLKTFDNTNSEVVVNSDLMKNYIQENYPSYKLVSSTTKCIRNKQQALDEIANEEYYQVCLDYNLNKDMDFLNAIPTNLRYKVEFLCNALCPPNCPYRKQHYSDTGLAHLTFLQKKYTVLPKCGITASNNHPSKIGKGNNLAVEDIEKYSQMGFQHFKLEGRTLSSETFFGQLLYYLIKPEYHFILIEEVFKSGILLNGYNDPQMYEYLGEKACSRIIY